jgi:hypothetical protein
MKNPAVMTSRMIKIVMNMLLPLSTSLFFDMAMHSVGGFIKESHIASNTSGALNNP